MAILSQKISPPDLKGQDRSYMQLALRLAHRGLGSNWPNPSVGCIIVKDNKIIGRGWTGQGGRPHAEHLALLQAGKNAAGATVYVTLEPCSHHGETPPCVDALISAKVKQVVVAIIDPDKRVSGKGLAKLRSKGIDVELGVCADSAAELNAGFFNRVNSGRPMVTLKLATSLDGFIATANGDSKWITSLGARLRGHLLRSEHDAILVGIGTVLKDNPSLTVRLPGLFEKSPVRIILDSRLRTPKNL